MVAHARATRLLQLVQDNASPLTYEVLRRWVKTAQRMAGLKVTGKFHVPAG